MKRLQSQVRRWTKSVHQEFRGRKLDSFLRLVGGRPRRSLLDVGGGPGIADEFLRLYASFDTVKIVNLGCANFDPPPNVQLQVILADGCFLPFRSRSFDWVFSNAVIEHVGDWERQKLFANEVRRVAVRGYFVTTPNKYFPIDPHTLLPFYQLLPDYVQRTAVRISLGALRNYEEMHSLSRMQLQLLFPEAHVESIGTPILANSLAAAFRSS